jgi:hypothetical protein
MSLLDTAEARLAEQVAHWSGAMGARVDAAPRVVAMRAGLIDLGEPGAVSANGSCRMIRAADGWLAVNLARASDHALVPALLGRGIGDAEVWQALAQDLARWKAGEVVAQATLLGLAVARVGETPCPAPRKAPGAPRPWDRPPVVVDLSALWAGPLCGALLAGAGCAVTKVETCQRPDTTAARSPALDARLNGAKARWLIDPGAPDDQSRLRALLAGADVVITSARPRALGWLARLLAPGCVWVAIRAHADPARIGFGDDCAAAGGLVGWQDGAPQFLGDAAADPLTGLAAATLAFRALALRQAGRVSVALAAVAAWARQTTQPTGADP